jgi:osmoprotectant transport system ATP-binding protein
VIELDGVTKRYGGTAVVEALSLTIAAGEFCALVGPSGSGKSTTLRMINQLVRQSEGTIRFGGSDVSTLSGEALRRRMGYVIQSFGLFPHWTVERNIATVPALLGWPKYKIRDRVDELLTLLRLDPASFRGRYPHQLSGGQQQRIGIARALAADPEVLLMDEPFAALDPPNRAALHAEMARIHRQSGKTIVMVTHDIEAALQLASRIALLDRGRLLQWGTPLELLTAPADERVADFVGRAEQGLRLLSLARVGERVRPGETAPGPPVAAAASLREALSEMIARGTDRLAVIGDDGRPAGVLHLADLVAR